MSMPHLPRVSGCYSRASLASSPSGSLGQSPLTSARRLTTSVSASSAVGLPSKRFRQRSSRTLDEAEAAQARDAAESFLKRVHEADSFREAVEAAEAGHLTPREYLTVSDGDASDSGFGDPEQWPHYQELLKRVAESHRGLRDAGELESATDRAVTSNALLASKVLSRVRVKAVASGVEGFVEDNFFTASLQGCVFVGHAAADLDSIAGAVGAAELFKGTAVKAEAELSGDVKYALAEVAHLEEPPLFDDCPGCVRPDETGQLRKICLVNHNDQQQMVRALREDANRAERIAGLIDHHALSESFSSRAPLLIDVRPWGAASTIVAHLYVRSNVHMRPEVARLLMCGILSDTLNLLSVTTTEADRFAVALLAKLGSVEDPDEVARLMFRAKTGRIASLGPYAMVRGDQKDFTADGWKYGIAVLEVADVQPVLEMAADLILELRTLKIEKGGGVLADELDFAFLFVVDVVSQCSVLIVCGGREYALAREAFPGCRFRKANAGMQAPGKTIAAEQTLCEVGPLVSRKAQFVPALAKVLNGGFRCHKERVSSPDYRVASDDWMLGEVLKTGGFSVVVDEHQVLRRAGSSQASAAIFGSEGV